MVLSTQYGGTEPITVKGTAHGYSGGQLFNFATISGGSPGYNRYLAESGGLGVSVGGGNFLSNSGLIEGNGQGNGVYIQRNALAINYGTITGNGAAIMDGGTLINAGTLSGAEASVYFNGDGGTLEVYPNAVFIGAIFGAGFGNGSDIIFDGPLSGHRLRI